MPPCRRSVGSAAFLLAPWLSLAGCVLDWSSSSAGPRGDAATDAGRAPSDSGRSVEDGQQGFMSSETGPGELEDAGGTSDAADACACGENAHCSADGACVCDEDFADDGSGGCQRIDDCPAGACPEGECIDGIGDYSCDCPGGFGGTGTKECFPVLYCPEDVCSPGGTCVDEPDWSCMCDDGFEGTGTQACTNVDDCPTDACLPPNGTCEDGVNAYMCECNPGYSGTNCETDVCSPNPCMNDGTCSRTGTLCSCPTGFGGDHCEVDVCDPNPCEHGGTCSRTDQGAACSCEPGYTGATCETDIDECAGSNVCTNPEYPCEQTVAPGYTCLGQFADWHMPAATAGAKYSPSYDTSTPDIVVDNVTGLMWEQASQQSTVTWQTGQSYCNALGLGGYDNWRMPTKIELESILDESRSTAPYINTTVFAGASSQTVYWSSSSYAENPDEQAWALHVGFAMSSFGDKTSGGRVRCVRGSAVLSTGTPADRYDVDEEADTVTDTRTDLIWQRTVNTNTRDWEAAKAYCAARGTGWRLPAFKELLTLVDPTHANPATASVFPRTPGEFFIWSASDGLGSSPDSARVIGFANGFTDFWNKTSDALVRCVR